MQRETAADYRCAVHHLRDVFEEYNLPTNNATFVTDRELALSGALNNTFPTANMLLCRWHINKNILAKHKAGFKAEAWETFMKAWNALISATTVESYQEQLQVKFCLPFPEGFLTVFYSNICRQMLSIQAMDEGEIPAHVMHYCNDTWLVYNERFVSAFLRGKKHYGHVLPSRVESAHAALKKWFGTSTGKCIFQLSHMWSMLLLPDKCIFRSPTGSVRSSTARM